MRYSGQSKPTRCHHAQLKNSTPATSSATTMGKRSPMSTTRKSQDGNQRPSCCRKMRRAGLQRISPSCRSCLGDKALCVVYVGQIDRILKLITADLAAPHVPNTIARRCSDHSGAIISAPHCAQFTSGRARNVRNSHGKRSGDG